MCEGQSSLARELANSFNGVASGRPHLPPPRPPLQWLQRCDPALCQLVLDWRLV